MKYSIIQNSLENGELLLKEVPLISSPNIDIGKLTATRHANGRDWWVLQRYRDENRFARFLVSPDTIVQVADQIVGDSIPSGVGQARFSPDGTRYACLNMVAITEPKYLDIYDFDRETGELSHAQHFEYPDTAIVGGLEFSPNSRFLYLPLSLKIFQIDLEDPVTYANPVLIRELAETETWGYGIAQLGPDDKIYITAQGAIDSLHVIHNPNLPFPACNFDQLGFPLPAFSFRTIPNFPYYGLGPLDGSAADTLGIDNPTPTAAFEYYRADSSGTQLTFFDASQYGTSWSWDFGDGSPGSAFRHPEHTYAQPGLYTVCLTATNLSGSHTYCEEVDVLPPVSSADIYGDFGLDVGPNPLRETLFIRLAIPLEEELFLELYALDGRPLERWSLAAGQSDFRFSMGQLPAGTYSYRVSTSRGEVVRAGRLLRQ
ncbi:MAG: PKD domain-containing protein [Bacteroidota bacterium]